MEDEQWVEPHKLPLNPRLQWFENHGYCGEVSLISAGLYYGQYVSQYTARQVASTTNLAKSSNNSNKLVGVPSQCEASSCLLLNANGVETANRFNLSTESWHAQSNSSLSTSLDFLQWVKGHVLAGHPVAIGVYANQTLFNGEELPPTRLRMKAVDEEEEEDCDDDIMTATASTTTKKSTTATSSHVLPPFPAVAQAREDYDHIVLVYGISASFATPRMTQRQQCEKDIVYFHDHGLWGNDKKNPPFLFSYTSIAFQANRKKANLKNGTLLLLFCVIL
jgi:hypothetical protein